MSLGEIASLMRGGVLEVAILGAPILLVALGVGLIIAILQATTSIQEQTLSFVPKILAILVVLALFGGLMYAQLGDYTTNLFQTIPGMAR
jgi:flagellar biosynthetic protein FliQ